ncbi:MAG: glycosyltransferase [bacterium]
MGKIENNNFILLHFSDCFYPRINGVTTAIYSISKSLEKYGIYNIIIAPSYESSNDIIVEDFYGLDIVRIPSLPFIFNKEDRFILFSNTKKIYQFLINMFKERNISHLRKIFLFHNVMNSYFVGENLYKFFVDDFNYKDSNRLLKIFYYHTFWDYYLHYIPLPRFISSYLLNLLEKKVFKSMDYVFVANSYVKNFLGARFSLNGKVLVKPLPLNPLFFGIIENESNKNLTEKNYFLYVGRLGKEKNVYFLIDVFYEIFNIKNDFYLYLVGDGPEKKGLIEYIRNKGIEDRVLFLGYLPQKDIIKLYQKSKGLIFTSKTETLGLVVLEAMSAGTIVFTLNVPPFNDIIFNNVDGILVEREDKSYFAGKVLEVLQSQELVKNLKNNAIIKSKSFHPDCFAQKFIELVNCL